MRRYNISKRMLSLLLVLALSLPSVFQVLAAEESAVGTTVQLAKTEGTVSVTNANDRKATILKNMKLYNGYHVSTEEKSYSWINLDSTKLIKEDASSQVEIRESGKKLEVLLNSGNLFFNVTKDLEEETLNIRTSTMVAGIRGTCGWVRVVDRWNTYVYILEGRVECRVADPVTGQIKKTILTGGEQANFVVYPQDREGDKCDILQKRFTETDIPGFVLVELVQDRGLCRDIYDDSGLDVLGKYPSEEEAQRRLEEDQAEAAKRQEEISAQETRQENNISKDPVWKETPSGGSSGGGLSSGGSSGGGGGDLSTPTRPGGATTLTLPVTVPQIIDALALYDTVNVVPGPGSSDAEHTLTIDQDLTVPAGQTLNVADGDTGTSVQPGQTLQVDGTMHLEGGFTNEGTLNVTSSNTFRVDGEFYVETTGVVHNYANGRIISDKGIFAAGTIVNSDSAEITSGGLATIMTSGRASVSASGGWITNTNPEGGFALTLADGLTESAAGIDSDRLRAVTPFLLGNRGDSGWSVIRPAGGALGLRNGFYQYADTAGIARAETLLNCAGGAITNSLTPVREGYAFQGWNTAADGSGTSYTGLETDPPSTVYAQWGEAYDVTFSGKVTDANNNAIAGATVTLGGNSAVSGDDGTYTLTARRIPVGTYTLTAQVEAVNLFNDSGAGDMDNPGTPDSDKRTFTDSKTVTIENSNPVVQDFSLALFVGSQVAVFTGTVTKSDGQPAPDVSVILDSSSSSASYLSNTNADGVYTTPPLLIGRNGMSTITLSVLDSPYGSATQSIRLRPVNNLTSGVITQNLQLSPVTYTITIKGTVNDQDNNPIPDVQVQFSSIRNGHLTNYTSVKTKDDGTYSTVINPPIDAQNIYVIAVPSEDSGYNKSATTSFNSFSDGQTLTADFTLQRTTADDPIILTIQGQVYSGKDESGNPTSPVSGATITVTSNKPDTGPSIVGAAPSGPDGKYSCVITVNRGETVTVSVGGIEGYILPAMQTFKVDETYISGDVIGADFELSSPAAELIKVSVSGKVTDGTTGDPIFGATVTATSTSSGNSFSQTTDENGLFSIKNILSIAGDTIIVGVQAFGYGTADPQTATVGQDGILSASNFDFALTPAAMRSVTISGKVTDEQDTGVSDADVKLYRAETSRAADDAPGFAVGTGVKSGGDGTYTIAETVPEGTYVVKATAGGRTVSSEQIVITETSTTIENVNVKVGISYTIENGVLTVVGCGAIQDYDSSSNRAPWYNDRSSFTSLDIKDRVTRVGNYAFDSCRLSAIDLPKNITSIGQYAFYGNTALQTVKILGEAKIESRAFFNCTNLTDVTMPDVTTVGAGAFYNCSKLTGVVIPDGVTSIGANAFVSCTVLSSITIPNTVTEIGNNAFYKCTALTDLTIPDSVTSIGAEVCYGCNNLKALTLSNNITEIPYRAFMETSLTSVTIPESVTAIGADAFRDCQLDSVIIPENVVTIGSFAFGLNKYPNYVKSVTFSENAKLKTIGDQAFNLCRLTELTIPASVETIERQAFNGCTNLAHVELSAGLTSIKSGAFSGCPLTTVTFNGSKTEWDTLLTNTGSSNDALTKATVTCTDGTVSPAAMASLSRIGLPGGRLAGASIRPVLRGALSVVAAAPGDFADVSADSWYADAADYCRTAGLMTGAGGGTFDPEGRMTRAMVAAVLHRLAGSPVPEGEGAPFTDVTADSWYAKSVLWAQESSVMNGHPDGRFDPEGAITREQLAAALWRLAGSPEAGDSTFADSAFVASYAAPAAGWAGGAGIINGMPDGRFAPKGSATRAQTAQIITNYVRVQGLAAACSAMDIMCAPAGATLMPDGSLLVTDTYNKVIWRVADGVSAVYAGSSTVEDHCGQPLGGYNDAVLEESYFKRPWAIVPFLDGWAVSDTGNGAIRLISGGITQTVNGQTEEKLTVSDLGVTFDAPTGLACDGEGNLYVADTLQNAIRKITPTGEVTTFAKDLDGPMGLFWAEDSLYAAETEANRIVKITAGKVEVLAGSGRSGFADGPAAQAAFSAPQALAVDEDGTVYVADTANGAVRRIRDGQVTTLLHRDVTDLDSFAPVSPTGLLIRENILYICDNFSRKLLVFPL